MNPHANKQIDTADAIDNSGDDVDDECICYSRLRPVRSSRAARVGRSAAPKLLHSFSSYLHLFPRVPPDTRIVDHGSIDRIVDRDDETTTVVLTWVNHRPLSLES